MATIPAQIENSGEGALALVEQVDADPKLLLLGKVDRQAYLRQLREAVWDGGDADISSQAGRDRIKSAAQSVRTRRAEMDRTRKGLTEHWRKQTAAVNEAGKVLDADFVALIEEVRAPLTAWEQAEEARKDEANRILQDLESAPVITFGMTSEALQALLDRIRGINLNPDVLGVRTEMAVNLRDEAVAKLTEAVAALRAQEAQAAELERLRAEQAAAEERQQREESERRAKEEAEARAKAEAERIERAKAEAAEAARLEAEAAALREQEAREAEARRQIEEAERRAAEAERAKQAEIDRIAREEAARKAAADAAAQEQARREADIAHRQQVIETAAEALTGLGLTKKLAVAVVNEIAAGTVPAVRITF